MNAILPSFLIGLREGLEGTLVVSILIAYLVKAKRSDRLPHVWAGVVAALLLSVGAGALLEYTGTALGSKRELYEAVTSVVAVGFVTWMIFWMRRTARSLKGELTGKLDEALKMGTFAVVAMAFLAVVREGLETALFFIAAARGAGEQAGPLIGIAAGVATSVVLGALLYRAALRINLTRFFFWTGLALIFVAAGIFKYGFHDFQEAGVLGGLNTYAFDITGWYDPTAWYAALLSGLVNFTPQPTVVETVAWLAYLVPVLTVFLWPAPAAVPSTKNEGARL